LVNDEQEENSWQRLWTEVHENPDSPKAKRLKSWAEKNKDTNYWAKKLYDEDHQSANVISDYRDKSEWKSEKGFKHEWILRKRLFDTSAKHDKKFIRVVDEWADKNQATDEWARKWKKAGKDGDYHLRGKQIDWLRSWVDANKDTNDWAKKLHEANV